MRKLLNTLYVSTQGSYLSKDGECVVVSVEKQEKLRLPIHTLSGIVCFGNVMMSPFLMGFCAGKDVGVSFLSENGKFLARIKGPVSGNVLLRRQQYRMADSESLSATVAKHVLSGKISNARTVLQRFLRDHEKNNLLSVKNAAEKLGNSISKLKIIGTLDGLRGIEGDAAKLYFAVFDNLITVQKEDFSFKERSKRPPLDNTNAMLSFLYTILAHDVSSALETVGLDPAVGFLHRDRPGRDSLALDIMEELRPFIADRLVLSLINLRRVSGKGFRKTESGAVLMDDAARKEVLIAYQERKRDEIVHPFLNEKIPVGLIPFVQALLLSRYVREDIDGYPPFIWR